MTESRGKNAGTDREGPADALESPAVLDAGTRRYLMVLGLACLLIFGWWVVSLDFRASSLVKAEENISSVRWTRDARWYDQRGVVLPL